MASPLQISLKVTGLDQAKNDLQQFANAGKRSFDELANEAKSLSDSASQSDRALTGVANRVRQMAADLNPAAARTLQLRNSLVDVNRALAANLISTKQATDITASLRREHDQLTQAGGKAVNSVKATGAAVQNLTFQLNDLGTQLASGGGFGRAIAQQGGQIVQAFQQGGGVSAVLGAAAASLKSLITPTTAAIAGVAALGAGFAALIIHANNVNSRIREFNVTLNGMGVASNATAQQLETMSHQLRDVGLSASEAAQQILAVTRAGLNPAAAGRIVTTGRDIGAITGADGVKQLTDALKGGLEPTIAFGLELRKLTAEEVANYREMARHGQAAEALNDAFNKISSGTAGSYKNSLSSFSLAILEVKKAWDAFLESLSKSPLILGTIKVATDLLNAAARALGSATDAATKTPAGGRENPLTSSTGGFGASIVIPPATVGAIDESIQRAVNFITGQGEKLATAIGIAATMAVETTGGRRIDPSAFNPAGGGQGAYGIVQARGERQPAYRAAGDDLIAQLKVFFSEIRGEEARNIVGTRTAGERGDAAGAARGMQAFERGEAGNAEKYAAAADRIAAAYKGVKLSAEEATKAGVEALNPDVDPAKQAIFNERMAQLGREAQLQRDIGGELDVKRAKQEAETFAAQNGLGVEQTRLLVAGSIAVAQGKVTAEQQKILNLSNLEVSAQNSIADAYGKSAKAGAQAELAAKAGLETYQQTGEVNEKSAAAQARYVSLLKEATAQQQVRNVKENQAQLDTQEQIKLEISLQGQTSEEITKQVGLLKEKQRIEEQFPFLSEKERAAKLATAQATADLNTKLQQTQREQARINDAVRSVGESISSNIGQAIEDSFNGKKVEDWGAKIKGMLASLASQIATSFIIRPIIGDVIGSLGFPAAAQGFGSLTGSGGGGTSVLGGVGQVGQLAGSANNLGILGDAFSGLKSSISGLTTSLNNFGASTFGLANPALQGPTLTGATLGEVGSLGSASLTGLLGGVGLGFGAGSLLNSLVGGSKLGGTLGSGGGAIAGALIGSIIPGIGTLIGGLIGGAGGGLLGGLFGGRKPDLAGSATIDLLSGRVGGVASAGNAQNDATARQLIEAITQFSSTIQALTGGTVGGGLTVSAGSRRGIVLSGAIGEDFRGEASFGQDAGRALSAAKLAIVSQLEGISDVMRTVIGQVSDPDQLESAIQFAGAYDKIKTAFDTSFKDIEQETSGPFASAMQQITDLFKQLSDNATKFGLALEPIGGALAEATKRLQKDFITGLEQADFTASGRGYLSQIAELEKAATARLKEAQAIGLGGDDKTLTLLDRINKFAQMDVLKGLSGEQIKDVIDHFKGLDDVTVELARSMQNASGAQRQLAEQQDAFRKTLDTNLLAAFRESQGLGALNQVQALYQREADLEKQAAALGLAGGGGFHGGGLDDQIGQLTHYSAIALLTGMSEEDFKKVKDHLAEFPAVFADWTTEAEGMRKALQDVAKAEADRTRILEEAARIEEYLKSLQVQNDFTSPESRLAAAAKQFNEAIAAAQAGDVDAMSKVTGYADAYIKQAAAFYASSEPGQAIFQAVQEALRGLPGVGDNPIDVIDVSDIEAVSKEVTDSIAQLAKDLQALNDAAVAAQIAQNNRDRDALIAANDKAAKDIVAGYEQQTTALIATNDNATVRLMAESADAASRILAGSSADATAIGQSVFWVGNQQIQAENIFADSNVSAIYGAAAGIVEAGNAYADNNIRAIYGSINGLMTVESVFANNQITATYGAASTIVTALYNHSNANLAGATWQVQAVYDGSTAIIGAISALSAKIDSLIRAVIDIGNAEIGQEVATVANLQVANEYLRRMAS